MKTFLLSFSLLAASLNVSAAGFFEDIIEGVAKEVIGVPVKTKENNNSFGELLRAQDPLEGLPAFKCSQHIVSAGKFDINGNQLGSLCALNEETLSAKMEEYKIENQNDKEKVNFGWSFLNSEDGFKNLIRIMDESVRNGKNKGLLLMDTRLSGQDSTLEVVILFDTVSEKAPSEMALISALEKKFRAADPTNSLNGGNKFRIALEQKYGTPVKVINAEKAAKALIIERDKKIAEFKKSYKMNDDQVFALQTAYLNPINSQIAEYQKLGNQDIQLFWKNNAGEELTILREPYDWYILRLESKPSVNAYLDQVKSKLAAFNKDKVKNAPIPKL